MKNRIKRAIALLLTAVMLFTLLTGCAAPLGRTAADRASGQSSGQSSGRSSGGSSGKSGGNHGSAPTTEDPLIGFEDIERPNMVPYPEMPVEVYDRAGIDAVIDELLALIKSGGNDEAVKAAYEAGLIEIDKLYNSYALWNNLYYSDYSNEEAQENSNELSTLYSKVADAFLLALRQVLESEYGDMMETYIDDEEFSEYVREYEKTPDEVFDLMDENNEIVNEYQAVVNDESMETADVQTKCAEIYLSLLDNLIAQNAYDGNYETYSEYIYTDAYNRDYTLEDSETLHQLVKEKIVPLYNDFVSIVYDNYSVYSSFYYTEFDESEIMSKLDSVTEEIGPVYQKALDFMQEYGLYDISYSDKKLDVGYTITLPYYYASFIFDKPSGSYNDMETMIHESGHFYANYVNPMHALLEEDNLDVAEIHSQGLEVLMLEHAAEIYGDDQADIATAVILMNMLSAVVDGCVFDEFQTKALQARMDGTLNTAQDVVDLFHEVEDAYGAYLTWGDSWYYVSHTYESPFYYMSYATSALAALDILAIAEENRQDGINVYNAVVKGGFSIGFREDLTANGLYDVFTEDGMDAVCEGIVSKMGDISLNDKAA